MCINVLLIFSLLDSGHILPLIPCALLRYTICFSKYVTVATIATASNLKYNHGFSLLLFRKLAIPAENHSQCLSKRYLKNHCGHL